MININLNAWKKIPAQHQKTIEAIAARLEPEFWAVSAQADIDSVKKLTAQGMEIVPVSASMRSEIQKRTKPLLDEYLQRTPAAVPIIKRYLMASGTTKP